jgi:ribonucleoside-diphosphate reductase alpha chain
MVCLDMDHPEIVDFINWKVREEKKAQALIAAGYASDFNGDAYHTVSGPELEQLGPRDDAFMRAALERRARGRRSRAPRARWSRRPREGSLAAGRRGGVGLRRPGVQYDTTINRGTRARTRADQRVEPRARSTCSSTTRPATCRA